MMTPEQFNIITTVLQDVSSSIELVGHILILFMITYLVSTFMK